MARRRKEGGTGSRIKKSGESRRGISPHSTGSLMGSSSSSDNGVAPAPGAGEVLSVAALSKLSGKELRARLGQAEALLASQGTEKEVVVAGFEAQLGVSAETAHLLRDEVHRLRSLVYSLQTTKETPAASLNAEQQAEADAERIRIAAELEATKNELSALKKRETEQQELLKETTDALYEWKEAYEALEAENVEMDKEIQALSTDLDDIAASGGENGGAASARKEVRELKRALQSIEDELQQARVAIADKDAGKEELEQLAEKAEALGLEVNAYKAELRESKDQAESYQQGFCLYQGFYLEAAQKVDHLIDEVNLFKKQCRETNSQLEVRTMVADSLREEYLRVEALRSIAEEELQELKENTSLLSEWSRSIMRSLSKL